MDRANKVENIELNQLASMVADDLINRAEYLKLWATHCFLMNVLYNLIHSRGITAI